MRPLKLALALSLLAAPLLAQPGVVASPRWKPPVANLAALPATGNTIGDTRIALDTMVHYTWDGDSWETAVSGGGAGTVTSVAIAVPAEWTVSGSPITDAGTITISEATQTANTVYAGPASGGAATPGFRSLVSDDIPNNAADTSGNAATATTATTASALAANGANCSAGQYPLGVDASGAAESCTPDDTGTDDQTATEVAYTPTTGTDWTDPDPTHVGGGLDALAARLTVEEAKADDDVPESGDFGAAADLESDGSLSIDVVAAAEMADADHGDVSWSGGVATVEDLQCTNCIGGTEIDESSLVISGFLTGAIGAVDNAILRADTVGGGVQASAVTIDDTGLMVIPGGLESHGSGTEPTWSVRIGGSAVAAGSASSQGSVALGKDANANGTTGYGAVAVGRGATAQQNLSIAIGTAASATGPSIAIGGSASAAGNEALALGNSATASQLQVTVVGIGASATASQATVLGAYASAAHTNSIAIGKSAATTKSNQTVLGTSSTVETMIYGGLLSARVVEASTAGSGAPNVLTATESNKVFTNEGATAKSYQTLPSAVAGLYFPEFVVADADGLRVTAAAGDVIHLSNGQTSTAGGYCESTTQWTSTSAQAINATDWYGKVSGTGWTCDGP